MSILKGFDNLLAQEEKRQIGSIRREMEELTKQSAVMKKEIDKYVAEEKSKLNDYKVSLETELKAREKEVKAKEKAVEKRVEESKVIQDDFKRLEKAKSQFATQKKEVQSVKSAYLEKAREAELITEQYNMRLDEIGQPKPKPKPAVKKVVTKKPRSK